MAKIHSPVKGYTGRRAGVAFADGVGETSDQTSINYFLRHGYKVVQKEAAATPAAPSGPPAKSAPKGDWVAYAVSQGIDEAEANAMKKPDLIAKVTGAPADPSDPNEGGAGDQGDGDQGDGPSDE